MNKLTILFLTMLLTCLPMAMRADSHKEKRDDTDKREKKWKKLIAKLFHFFSVIRKIHAAR